MGFDNECIINIQSLKGEYFCPVCRLLVYPNEALQTQCSHLYCKPCLTYVVRTTQACPYDGYLVTEADSKPLLESNRALADTIAKIPVHCLFHRSGCTWQGPLADCTSHCSGCAFGSSLVVCNRCGIQIVHRQVQEHAQNCPGVQAQAQQPDNGQGTSGAVASAPSNQNQTVAPAGTPASQVPTSQASVAPLAGQIPSQQVNPTTQAQAAQAAMPNPEQWYQQQQQYQQYYQLYPGYDPYQQQYQQYYPYQQQAVQQYQQPMQAFSSQVPGQHQPHPQSQFQTQQQVPASQTLQQPQQQSQVPPTAQPQQPSQVPPAAQPQQPSQVPPAAQPQPYSAQVATNIQQQIQPAGQPQTLQNQVAYSVPHSQPQAYSQVQPYTHPQTGAQAGPQQGVQMPQYQQTHPQMQSSHPQVQTQPYSQPHAQTYSHPQTHPPAQAQTHPFPSSHTVMHPPPHPNQPMNQTAQPQAQPASAHAVTGYQSYPQPQPQPPRPTQTGVPPALRMPGSHQQPSNLGQAQRPFPQQPAQLRPPLAPAMMPNQQPTMAPSQVQHPGAPVAQVPAYPHSQHPGYPVQHHSGMQPIQHASTQPQGFPGHGPYMQQQPSAQAPVRGQAPAQFYQQNITQAPVQSNATQNYPSRPMMPQGGGQQPYTQAPGLANAVHMRPTQLSKSQPSVNQYPSLAVQGQELLKPSAADKLGDQNMEKGHHEQNNVKVDIAGTGSQSADMKKAKIEDNLSMDEKNSQYGLDNKKGLPNSSNTEILELKPFVGSDSHSHGVENGVLQEGNLKIKEETIDSVELSSVSKSADVDKKDCKENEARDVQPSKDSSSNAPPISASSLPLPQFAAHVPGSNSAPSSDLGRNQLPLIHHGPTPQQRPSGPSLLPSIPHSGTSQFLGHPPSQLRPQVPAQMRLSAQAFGMNDNAQMQFPKQPLGTVHPDNPSGHMLGAGTMASYGRGPGSIGLPPGHFNHNKFPSSLAGHPQGELIGRPPFVPPPPPTGGRGGIMGGVPPDFPEGNVGKPQHPNAMDGPGFSDGRQPELHPRGPMEQGPFGHPSNIHVLQDERMKMLPEEHLKPFPLGHISDRRDFEGDVKKFSRPSHLDGGTPPKYGTHFPPPGPLDQSPRLFGMDRNPRPFGKPPLSYDHDPAAGPASSRFLPPQSVNPLHPDAGDRPRPAGFRDASLGGFDHHGMDSLTPRSPGRDFRGGPTRGFGGFPGDIGGNESHSYPPGKALHESRFAVIPGHLQRGEFDGPPKHSRVGDAIGKDMQPSHSRRGEHFGPRSLHSGDATGHGAFGGHLEMGEPPFPGSFLPARPFGEAFGRDMPGYPHPGESGFRSSYRQQRYGHDGGFYRGEMEPFDNPRKRKPGSIMCRICYIDCETLEGLDMHSQTREHQKKAMDMVISIKQNLKKQKVSNDRPSLEEGRKPRTASFEGRGKKR